MTTVVRPLSAGTIEMESSYLSASSAFLSAMGRFCFGLMLLTADIIFYRASSFSSSVASAFIMASPTLATNERASLFEWPGAKLSPLSITLASVSVSYLDDKFLTHLGL